MCQHSIHSNLVALDFSMTCMNRKGGKKTCFDLKLYFESYAVEAFASGLAVGSQRQSLAFVENMVLHC